MESGNVLRGQGSIAIAQVDFFSHSKGEQKRNQLKERVFLLSFL